MTEIGYESEDFDGNPGFVIYSLPDNADMPLDESEADAMAVAARWVSA